MGKLILPVNGVVFVCMCTFCVKKIRLTQKFRENFVKFLKGLILSAYRLWEHLISATSRKSDVSRLPRVRVKVRVRNLGLRLGLDVVM